MRHTSYRYRLLVFSAAFLLFAVQPVIGKFILPWFGGSPSVWTTALLFFQALLLVGYLLAHGFAKLGRRPQAVAVIAVVALAALTLPITPGASWQPSGGADPMWHLIMLLAASVGLPYVVLAAASPLLQAWASASETERDTYRLYAWSNAGSLLGLLSYPLVVEPLFGVRMQTYGWSAAFLAFAAAIVWSAARRYGAPMAAAPSSSSAASVTGPRPRSGTLALWLALPFAASMMLISVTNYITQDVASVPFLWVLPLAFYLISFILTFDGRGFYERRIFALPFVLIMFVGALLVLVAGSLPLTLLVPLPLLLLAFSGFVCHGELYALRPHPSRLTSFYIFVAAGGALGGAFGAVVAPMVFPLHFEFHISVVFTLALVVGIWWRDRSTLRLRAYPKASRAVLLVACALAAAALARDAYITANAPAYVHRDFFGVLRVFETPEQTVLYNGRILHGLQLKTPGRECTPTSYYGRTGGLGLAASGLPRQTDLRIGIVGLGAGTTAVYGSHATFYELNPAVVSVAETRFTFLSSCVPSYDIVLGDARLSMERQEPQGFDLLAVDAFSGDAIPVHLLTVEAFEEYFRHLRPEGVLAIHTSNRYFDLAPVVGGIAEELGVEAVAIADDGVRQDQSFTSTWVLLSRDRAFFDRLIAQGAISEADMGFDRTVLWTDGYSNPLSVARFQ